MCCLCCCALCLCVYGRDHKVDFSSTMSTKKNCLCPHALWHMSKFVTVCVWVCVGMCVHLGLKKGGGRDQTYVCIYTNGFKHGCTKELIIKPLIQLMWPGSRMSWINQAELLQILCCRCCCWAMTLSQSVETQKSNLASPQQTYRDLTVCQHWLRLHYVFFLTK